MGERQMVVGGAAGSGRAGIGRRAGDPAGPGGGGIVRRDRDPSGDNGPPGAQRKARSDRSSHAPAADARRNDAHAADLHRPERPESYCPVTIVCGPRLLDLALPTAVCCADLLPGLLRLMLPDDAPAVAHPWVLVPIGGNPLSGSETLSEAGILAGDLLALEQRPAFPQADSAKVMTRDRIEDVVNGRDRFWGPPASRSFAHWAALLTWAVLLLPAANLPAGPVLAAMSATVALIVAMTAVLSDRRSEKLCAAVGLVLGCIWAALGGAAAFLGWAAVAPLTGAGAGSMTLMVAMGAALLLAGCAAGSYPAALIHTTSLLVVSIAGAWWSSPSMPAPRPPTLPG